MKEWLLKLIADRINLVAVVLLIGFGAFMCYAAMAGGDLLSVTTTVVGGLAALFTIVAAYVAIVSLNEWREAHDKGLRREAAARVKNIALAADIIPETLDQHLVSFMEFMSPEERDVRRKELARMDKNVHKITKEIEASCRELFAIDPSAAEHFEGRQATLWSTFYHARKAIQDDLKEIQVTEEISGHLYRVHISDVANTVGIFQDLAWDYYLSTF